MPELFGSGSEDFAYLVTRLLQSREIGKLEARISREKQFNKKVELNQKLQSLQRQLTTLS